MEVDEKKVTIKKEKISDNGNGSKQSESLQDKILTIDHEDLYDKSKAQRPVNTVDVSLKICIIFYFVY